MFTQVKFVIQNIRSRTKRVLTPQWTTYLIFYQITLSLFCLYKEFVLAQPGAFPFYVLTYLGFMICFHVLYIAYCLLRSNEFVDSDLFWITTLGALIYYNL